jgi:hypothetical protein
MLRRYLMVCNYLTVFLGLGSLYDGRWGWGVFFVALGSLNLLTRSRD